jgi:hypothetical protein
MDITSFQIVAEREGGGEGWSHRGSTSNRELEELESQSSTIVSGRELPRDGSMMATYTEGQNRCQELAGYKYSKTRNHPRRLIKGTALAIVVMLLTCGMARHGILDVGQALQNPTRPSAVLLWLVDHGHVYAPDQMSIILSFSTLQNRRAQVGGHLPIGVPGERDVFRWHMHACMP